MIRIKVTTVGNSAGVVLPKEILERLRVGEGDVLYAVETSRGIELSTYDPEFDEQMAVADQVMGEDRDALRQLAR